MRHFTIIAAILLTLAAPTWAADAKDESKDEGPLSAGTFSGLTLRGIGPAVASGRISDFAVDAADPSYYFLAVASGGVWKTVNNGATWTPVFDGEGSYSIGCVELDPTNRDVVWVGTRREQLASARFPSATAFTRASTAARRGRTWASARASTSA